MNTELKQQTQDNVEFQNSQEQLNTPDFSYVSDCFDKDGGRHQFSNSLDKQSPKAYVLEFAKKANACHACHLEINSPIEIKDGCFQNDNISQENN